MDETLTTPASVPLPETRKRRRFPVKRLVVLLLLAAVLAAGGFALYRLFLPSEDRLPSPRS